MAAMSVHRKRDLNFVRVYEAPVAPRDAVKAWVVRSRELGGRYRTTAYTVVWWKVPCGKELRSALTCSCKAAQEGKLCRHIAGIIRQMFPTASIWLTEADANRQKRHKRPFFYGHNLSRLHPAWITVRR